MSVSLHYNGQFKLPCYCSDRTNWDMYFGYCYGGGDCILCTKQIVDSGPGSPSVVGDCRLYGWWPLAVAGRIREFDVCSCRVRTCFAYVIKPPCYSVQIYECIPGIYVIARVI